MCTYIHSFLDFLPIYVTIESDTTERLHFHFSLSCIGEGNGNPLQCSCLENPRDGGAWWAAISGVARLKQLSSSSSRALSIVPCALQLVLISYLFYTQPACPSTEDKDMVCVCIYICVYIYWVIEYYPIIKRN